MTKKTQPKSKTLEGTAAPAKSAKADAEPAKSTAETATPKTPRLSPSLKAKAERIIAARNKKKAPTGTPSPKAKRSEPEEDLVVFAFRLSPQERDLIHRAAGPARASKFVRALAVAAACQDEGAIKLLLQSAKTIA